MPGNDARHITDRQPAVMIRTSGRAPHAVRYHVPTYAVRKSDRKSDRLCYQSGRYVGLRISVSNSGFRTRLPLSSTSAISAIISSVFNARRASPFTSSAMARRVSSCRTISWTSHSHGFCLPSPELVLAQYPLYSGISIDQRGTGKAVPIKLKRRVSVVAPIKVMVPSSICGRNASCWLLLKRVVTTKRIVRRPALRFCQARSIASANFFHARGDGGIRSTSALASRAIASAFCCRYPVAPRGS